MMNTQGMKVVPPGGLQQALEHVAADGRLAIFAVTRTIVIEQKHLDAWLAAGKPLLRECDDGGFRMRSGRSSVYLFPGQLKMID